MIFKVGDVFQEGISHYSEKVIFDFSKSGAALLLFFNEPTFDEIENVNSGVFSMKLISIKNVIITLFKFGDLAWVDAPYSVHLSPSFKFDTIKEGQGFGLNVFLIDASTGIIKTMRLIGLSNEISCSLKNEIEFQRKLPFDFYDQNLNEIFQKYTTNDLVRLAKISQ